MASPAAAAVAEFLGGEVDTLDRLLARPNELRLVVASLVRCHQLCQRIAKAKWKKQAVNIAAEIATWMAALTRADATPVMTGLRHSEITADLIGVANQPALAKPTKNSKKRSSGGELTGLMAAACRFDPETLQPAIGAALGHGHTGGRLAWEVSLPESMWHSDEGKIVAMLPEWDVRRGRTFLDYRGEDVVCEIMSGRSVVFAGLHQSSIEIDGVVQAPKSDWTCSCEYSDDDVHTIELEQEYTGGVVLQRQWMLVRDDRCLMIADAVIPKTESDVAAVHDSTIRCVSRIPLDPKITHVEDPDVREIVLMHGKRRRALCSPLAASEWRKGGTSCQMTVADDHHLVLDMSGRGAVYCPLWIDFQTRRFTRKRTWRSLTIAQDLQTIPRDQASAFRVQSGSEHWVIYRSLMPTPDAETAADRPLRAPQSFLGKHLVADFFAARFHPGDGGMEELVTVDGGESDE